MSVLGKGTLSIRKKDLQTQKSTAIGFTKLVFAYKATLGDSQINLSALSPSIVEMPGFTNPSASEIAGAKLLFTRKNLTLISSLKGVLVDYVSYTIPNSTIISFNNWTAEDGELFIGVIDPVAQTGLKTVDAAPIVKTGVLSAGNTQFIVGTAFPLNRYPNEQSGAVLVFVDGELQARNTANAAASPSADGNYHEDDAGGAVSNSITFNEAYAVDVNVMVISNGLIVSNPSDSRDQVVDTLATQVDVMAADLAQVTGNALSRYQTQPNQVDLAAFGNRVYQAEQTIAAIPTIQKFISGSGTYNTPANVKWIRVRMVGGGGGGGAANAYDSAGGGGAGGYVDAIITSPNASYSYSIGTAGVGGTSNGDGGAGGNTTFGSSLLVANGGGGGKQGAASPTVMALGGTASLGSALGIAFQGAGGTMGTYATSGTNAAGGAGGSSPFGGAGAGGCGVVVGGNAIANTGSGGGGGGNNSGANGGGTGASGMIIVEEFYK